MNKKYKILLSLVASAIAGVSQAGQPLLTFTPLTGSSVTVLANTTQQIFYQIRNNSTKTHTLEMAALPAGFTRVTTGQGVCRSPFVLRGGESCRLTLSVAGNPNGGSVSYQPRACQVTTDGAPSPYLCYQSSLANVLNVTYSTNDAVTTLTVSPSFLALSGLGGGTPRTFTVTNTGSVNADGMNVEVLVGSLPTGTTINNLCYGSLPPNNQCTFTITPGSTPTVSPGTPAEPTILSVSGTATTILYPQFEVLTYGSIYQNSFLFDMDDTTPTNTSIGGKGLELQNQNPSSNIGIGWANNYDTIGVWQGSTSPCVGSVDGSCNTQQIVQYAATHPGTYFSAAYYCANVTIDDYTGWYLPAQCEMTDYDSQCAGVQNIQSNLVDLNIPNLNIYSAIYQSSTELAPPNAFGYIFGWGFVGQNYLQTNKQSAPIYSASLRCARQFT